MMDLSKFPLDNQICTMEVASCKYRCCKNNNNILIAKRPNVCLIEKKSCRKRHNASLKAHIRLH